MIRARGWESWEVFGLMRRAQRDLRSMWSVRGALILKSNNSVARLSPRLRKKIYTPLRESTCITARVLWVLVSIEAEGLSPPSLCPGNHPSAKTFATASPWPTLNTYLIIIFKKKLSFSLPFQYFFIILLMWTYVWTLSDNAGCGPRGGAPKRGLLRTTMGNARASKCRTSDRKTPTLLVYTPLSEVRLP